jgi:hypothetical protein
MKNYLKENINIIGNMSELTDSVTKNFSSEKKKEFFKRYNDLIGSMSEDAVVDIVLRELFEENYAKGGIADLLKT